jgi:hypothetical protein
MELIGLVWDRYHLIGCCEHGNEHLGSVTCLDVLKHLSNCWPPKKDSVPLNQLVG